MCANSTFSRVIQPALSVELRWQSKVGMTYQIEESTDLIRWQPVLPFPIAGDGSDLTWTAPQPFSKKNYRVRES